MNKTQLSKFCLAALFVAMPTLSIASTYELKAQNGLEQGWSVKPDCEANTGTSCTSAYFCSNEIWMASTAFDNVQQRRYDGQQLVIVRDGEAICAVN